MRLPFPIAEVDEPDLIRDLIHEYPTVIVLPFIGESARRRFLCEWEKCWEDATLLLFLPGVECIAWERSDGAENGWRVWRRGKQRESVVKIYDEENLDHTEYWQVWTSSQTAVALRLGDKGDPIPETRGTQIRVFFETDERSPFPFLLHADLPVKEGRTNVLIDDESARDKVDEVIRELAGVVRRALASVPRAELLLDLVRPRVDPAEMGKVERQVWEEVKCGLADLRVPGASDLKLGSARLRPEGHKSWWWFDCHLWNAFKQLLSAHRAGGLSGLSLLPPGVDTDEREKTILHLNARARLTLEELRGLPLLPVEGRDAPTAPGGSNIFLPPQQRLPRAPEGIDIGFLKRRFLEAIERHPKSKNLRKVLIAILGISEFEPGDLIKRAILPVLRSVGQPDGLLDFLSAVIAPALTDEKLNFDWRDPVRREISECIPIQLQNGGLLPARQVYAGSDWTGNDFLERVYNGRNDRGFLHPPPADEKERERRKRLYLYVGVGWCPKVMPITCFADTSETYEGPRWEDESFSLNDPPESWSDYCRELDDSEMEPRNARLRQNWTLDGGSEVLMQEGAFSVISDNWGLYSKYREAIVYRSSNRREDYDNERHQRPSHLAWMFRTRPWVPVKMTPEMQGPEDVFVRPEIVRELAGWGYELDGDADPGFLKRIGVRSGWSELNEKDWHRWLQVSATIPGEEINNDEELRAAVRMLYGTALRHWKKSGTWSGPLWCIERHQDNSETWRRTDTREDVYFLDRPDLDELRLPDLWILPVRLNRLEVAAKDRLRLKLLSEELSGKPGDSEARGDEEADVRQRIKERLGAINAYLRTKYRENAIHFDRSNLPQVRVVKELRVWFSLSGHALHGSAPLDAFHSRGDDSWTLWLDGGLFHESTGLIPSVWECVASALVYAGDLEPDAQPCLKDLLLYEGADLSRKLLSLGVTKDTVDRIVPREPMRLAEVRRPQEKGGQSRPEQDQEEGYSEVTISRSSRHVSLDGGAHSRGVNSARPRSTSADQPGREAQEWMRKELKGRLEGDLWRVSNAPTHDEEFRETDIELLHDRFGTFHVEVKHRETGAIYWSEKEVNKAKANRGRYLLVVLMRGADEGFNEYWITDPLEALKSNPRSGIWEWRRWKEALKLTEGLDRWEVPRKRPARLASNFSFKIEVDWEWLENHGLRFEEIRAFLQTAAK